MITGITLAILIGLAALTVDLGVAFVRRTELQSAADMAALAAGWLLPTASLGPVTQRANQALVTNGFGGTAASGSPTIGLYTPDPVLAPAARYVAGGRWTCGGLASNAVQLYAKTTTPVFLGGIMGRTAAYAPQVVATASRNVDAAFRVGSGLLSINQSQSPVLNTVLNQLLHTGTNINLSAVDYTNLLNANVSALDFANALATQLQLTAGTYTGLLSSATSVGQVIAAEAAVLNSQGSIASAAVSSLQKLQQQISITGTPSLTLGQVLNFGAWNSQAIGTGSVPPAVFGTLNVYDLLSFAAQAANGANAVAIDLGTVSVPPLIGLTGKVTVIEPPQPLYYSFGRPCTVAHTAQVRASLTLQLGTINLNVLGTLGSLLGLSGTALVSLPVTVEVASGTATLTNVGCPTSAPGTVTATIDTESNAGLVSIGNSASDPGVLLNVLGLLKVTAFAQVPLLHDEQAKTFSFAPPEQQTAAQTQVWSSSSSPTPLSPTLLKGINSTITVSVLGLQASVVNLVQPLLNLALAGTAPLLDSIVQALLAALGIKLGNITVFALGARCGPPILVQ